MTAQHNTPSTAVGKPTGYLWPRDMVDLMSSFWGDLEWPRRAFGSSEGSLRIEETLDGDTMIVRAEIPGVDPERDVEISVDDGMLTISAKREVKTKETTKDGTFRSEFRYGRFVRQVRMPKNADLGALTAAYADGVIEIKVPIKAEEVPSVRKIEITRT